MSFDPATIGPEAKAYYIRIGKEFASDDVQKQLDISILGAKKYASNLTLYGWSPTQTQKAEDVRALIAAALLERTSAKAGKKTNNAALHDAVRAGKNARRAARAALTTGRHELFEQGKLDLVNQIDSVLAVTASSGADAQLLGEQLGTLGGLLANADIAPILGEAATSIQELVTTAATALDVAMKSKGRPYGTPAETEQLDLLDGVAAVLLRTLRHVARAAARGAGQPDIADAFELSALYDRPRHAKADPTSNPTS